MAKTESLSLNENMFQASGLPLYLISFGQLLIFVFCLLAPNMGYSEDLSLQSLSIRARVSEKTLLGDDAPVDFDEHDVSANFGLPWKSDSTSGWGMGTRLMASAGILQGAGEKALVVSLIPEWILRSEDGRFILDLGAGVALLSRYRFGRQDYGGPFQFALTFGAGVPLYKNLGIGYRLMHYSDAGVNGTDTTGADFQMIEFIYRP